MFQSKLFEQSRAEQSRAEQSRAEQSRAEQSRAEQSRAEQSRAEQSRRIEWIDIAKGIAILLVIIGHTVKFGSMTRNIIFSFHMPLFFILSGYTLRPAATIDKLIRHIKNNLKRLILPCLCISVFVVLGALIKSNSFSVIDIQLQSYKMLKSLFYASGVYFRGPAAGMVWFIFSLFWSKTLMDFIYVFQKNDYKYCTVGCLAFLGVSLGSTHNWQFQNFDVTLVALLFLYIGIQWRIHEEWINRNLRFLFSFALIAWSFLISQGIYIEMASRHYPYYSVCIIEAVLASFVFCIFCKSCVECLAIKKSMLTIGFDSIVIFYIHHCDWLVANFWYAENKTLKSICLRVSIILGLYIVYCFLRKIKNNKYYNILEG